MNLLTEHSFGELIKDSFLIYFKNFGTIYLIFFLPFIPVGIWQCYALIKADFVHIVISQVFWLMLSIFLTIVVASALSDICLGNKPTLRRAYGRATPVFGRYLWTQFLVMLIVLGGYLLLIIPGIFFSAFYMLFAPIVILENLSGANALKRSKELGKGFYLRNILATATFFVLFYLWIFVQISILSDIVQSIGINDPYLIFMMSGIISLIPAPLISIIMILIYYDLRVRKESYDTDMLTQDMVR